MMSGYELVRLGLGMAVGLAALPVAHAQDALRNPAQGTRLIGERNHGSEAGSVVWFPREGWLDAKGKRRLTVAVERGTLIPRDEAGTRLEPDELLNATVTVMTTHEAPVTFRVKRMNRPPQSPTPLVPEVDPTSSTYYYTLVTVPSRRGLPERPYCAMSPEIWVGEESFPVDADGGFQAVPVAEVWNDTATQGFNPGHFTMACMSGAIAKCYRWGYRAWRPMAQARAHVQACTRMAMADYCGDGRSHTMEGTPIGIYDFAQPPVSNAPRGPGGNIPIAYPSQFLGLDMQFETAWTGKPETCEKSDRKRPHCVKGRGGRECVPLLDNRRTPALAGGALCLSKKRWDAIDLRGESLGVCPRLEDPRMTEGSWPGPDQKCDPSRPRPSYEPGRFCDYLADGRVDHEQLIAAGALLFNGSPYLDALLSVWNRSNGNDRWTTVGKIDNGPYKPGAPDGYPRPATPLGSVLKDSTPTSVRENLPPLVTLYTYRHRTTGGHLTTTRYQPPVGYEQRVSQGLIHPCMARKPGPAGADTLYRYFTNARNEHHTTTKKPNLPPRTPIYCASSPRAPTSGVVIEGYLPRMGRD